MKYLIYTRKSTDTEDKQVLSLDAQTRALRELASKQGLTIVGEYQEAQSALKPGRPVFARMLGDITSGKANGIITWKIDRLARNMIDGGNVMELLTTGIIKEVVTPEKTHYSNDNILFMSVIFGMANQYSRDLSANVKRGNKEKLLRGMWPNKAPLGYINDRNTKSLILNRQEAYFVRRAFQLYASEEYSLNELTTQLNTEGFRTKSGKPVTVSNMHLLLQKTFYYGVMEWNGEYYPGTHEKLISKELFDQCQKVLRASGKARPQQAEQLLFTLRGTLSCALCGCGITAERQKGNHYYHCTNGKKTCDQKKHFVREEKLEQAVIKEFQKVHFDDELIEILYDLSLARFMETKEHGVQEKQRLTDELKKLNQRESLLTDKLLQGVISDTMYQEKAKELRARSINLEQKISSYSFDMEHELRTFELTKEAFKAFNFNDISFFQKQPKEKQRIFKKLLSNSQFKQDNGEETLHLQYKSPYDIIARAPYRTICPELLPD